MINIGNDMKLDTGTRTKLLELREQMILDNWPRFRNGIPVLPGDTMPTGHLPDDPEAEMAEVAGVQLNKSGWRITRREVENGHYKYIAINEDYYDGSNVQPGTVEEASNTPFEWYS